MGAIGRFPFGEPIRPVRQADGSAKDAFVLGVYASAVHARWVGPEGRVRIGALAVASEPEIFWRGDGAEEIVSRVSVPPGTGRLVPALPSSTDTPGELWTSSSLNRWALPATTCGSVIWFRTVA